MKNVIRNFESNKMFWCIFIAVICITARFVMGIFSLEFFDFKSFCIVGEIFASGRNVYAETGRYNYGPIWFIVIGWLYKIASNFPHSILVYKFMILSVLTITDIFIARLIAKRAGFIWGFLFFLNPISFLEISYHSQFDEVAVVLAAYGISFIEESSCSEKFTASDFAGTILLALSLITKHIMWAFPLWILFNNNIKLGKKILYAFIPPLLFLLSFLPYWSEGHYGIINHVFLYRSSGNFPLIALGIIQKNFSISLPILTKMSFPIYGLLISLSGYILRHEKIYDSFLLYTMAMVCFASGTFDNYFTIPLMAIFIFSQSRSIPAGWLPKCMYFLPYLVIRAKFWTNLLGMPYNETTKWYFLNIRSVFIVWCLLFYLIYYFNNKTKHKYS